MFCAGVRFVCVIIPGCQGGLGHDDSGARTRPGEEARAVESLRSPEDRAREVEVISTTWPSSPPSSPREDPALGKPFAFSQPILTVGIQRDERLGPLALLPFLDTKILGTPLFTSHAQSTSTQTVHMVTTKGPEESGTALVFEHNGRGISRTSRSIARTNL